jgi:putative transcriptional regulator
MTVLFAVLVGLLRATSVHGADVIPDSMFLVAKPELRDPLYGHTVLAVKSIGGGQQIGFILNRPTQVTLGRMVPSHEPSRKVADPIFIGGPFDVNAMFALVTAPKSPGEGSIEMMPGLYAAFHRKTIDRIIEEHADEARYLVGLVVWRPGELRHEIQRGAWYVLDPDAAVALREPGGLWEELVLRSQAARHLISTRLTRHKCCRY